MALMKAQHKRTGKRMNKKTKRVNPVTHGIVFGVLAYVLRCQSRKERYPFLQVFHVHFISLPIFLTNLSPKPLADRKWFIAFAIRRISHII
jgi:hypothetical protein